MRRLSPSQILGEIIEKCLKVTEQNSLNSITFPAVGTGNLRFPKPFVAKLMFDEVFKFSRTNPRHLQEVHFVLHPKDIDTITVIFALLVVAFLSRINMVLKNLNCAEKSHCS